MARSQLRGRLSRLQRAVAPPPAVHEDPSATPTADESGDLARELAAAFAATVTSYREHYNLTHQEAVAHATELIPAVEERALSAPPEQVSWRDLDCIAERDPERALQRWEEIKQAAREEVRSGHRAARALEVYDAPAWQRVQFLAVRAELAEAWRPRNALEQQLLDQLAQFQTMVWYWQETLADCQALLNLGRQAAGRGRSLHEPPRLSAAEAVDQAMGMVERYHRLYLRALKALQDQRRLSTPLIVRRAGQVNIGGQQINVSGRP
jgi:hypothetical protein